MIVYTAIFGEAGDTLRPPEYTGPGVGYVAFCDVPTPCIFNYWHCLPPFFREPLDPRRLARKHKLLSHLVFPAADTTVWIDGSITPIVDVRELVDQLGPNDLLAAFPHAQRKCVYDELLACITLGKDDPVVMRGQVARYRREGYPARYGLAETGVLVRKHTPAVEQFNELWWSELAGGSLRDQLSFDYAAWKAKLEYTRLPGTVYCNRYFQWRPHAGNTILFPRPGVPD